MSLYKDGKYWYYDFQYRGERYKVSTRETSKIRAKLVEATRLRELKDGVSTPPVQDITFHTLSRKYLDLHAANKRGKKFYHYTIRVLNREFGDPPLSRIGPAEVDAFMAKRRAEVATATANRSLVVLKHMFKLAVRWNHLSTNPAADLKPEREPTGREFFLTEEEAAQLLRNTPEWLRPLLITALHTGARQGELLALRWRDVDFKRTLLTFPETKNNEVRKVKMSATVRDLLHTLPSRVQGWPRLPQPERQPHAPGRRDLELSTSRAPGEAPRVPIP